MSLRAMYDESVCTRRRPGLNEIAAGRWKVNRRFRLSFLRVKVLRYAHQLKVHLITGRVLPIECA